jgi:thiamine transport system substrate-binding protein
VAFADPQPATSPIGVVAASCFRQVEAAGILAGTEHEEEARQVIDLFLSSPSRRTCRCRCSSSP